MKTLKITTALAAAVITSSTAFSQVLFTENFNSYTAGSDLAGQGSWILGTTNSPRVTTGVGSFSPANTTNVASFSTGTTGNTWAYKVADMTPDVGNTTGSLTFDIARGGVSTSTLPSNAVGIMNNDASAAAFGFGTIGASLRYLPSPISAAGTIELTDISGTVLPYGPNNWYQLNININFATNTISSVFVTDLNTSTTVQAYFGAGNATQSYTLDEASWDRFYIRQGRTNDSPLGYLDNISLNAVPEPGSVVLLGIATLGFLASRRRRA